MEPLAKLFREDGRELLALAIACCLPRVIGCIRETIAQMMQEGYALNLQFDRFHLSFGRTG